MKQVSLTKAHRDLLLDTLLHRRSVVSDYIADMMSGREDNSFLEDARIEYNTLLEIEQLLKD